MNKKYYYDVVADASKNILWHPGIQTISKIAGKAHTVLDVGCGEGTKLNEIIGKHKKGTGVDISAYSIKKAQKQYPHQNFILVKDENLPFPSSAFDLVYSTFVLEHTHDPGLFIKEMIRVTKKNGHTIILCPNYGAPNRRSPVSTEKPIPKLLHGYFGDLFCHKQDLKFTRVSPKEVFKNIDDDTTCEPYLHTLIRFIGRFPNIKIKQATSLWEIDADAKSPHQRLFKFFGQKNVFPFRYWGPQLLAVVKKTT